MSHDLTSEDEKRVVRSALTRSDRKMAVTRDALATAKHETARGPKVAAPISDPHFYALIVPVPTEKHSSARNRRRREARLLDQAKEILILGMSLTRFNGLSVTEQFVHLHQFVPVGWRPVSFKEKQP